MNGVTAPTSASAGCRQVPETSHLLRATHHHSPRCPVSCFLTVAGCGLSTLELVQELQDQGLIVLAVGEQKDPNNHRHKHKYVFASEASYCYVQQNLLALRAAADLKALDRQVFGVTGPTGAQCPAGVPGTDRCAGSAVWQAMNIVMSFWEGAHPFVVEHVYILRNGRPRWQGWVGVPPRHPLHGVYAGDRHLFEDARLSGNGLSLPPHDPTNPRDRALAVEDALSGRWWWFGFDMGALTKAPSPITSAPQPRRLNKEQQRVVQLVLAQLARMAARKL